MKKSALVLSGGGVLGVAHLGFLHATQKNYTFDWYAGVSAGAIVAACLALGKTTDEIWKIILEKNLFGLLFDFTPRNFGLFSGEKVYKILDEIFEEKTFEDLQYPLFIGATDFSTGHRVTINSGALVDAVRASLSVPVIFEPFWHSKEQKWLVDGGLSQNFPVDIAIENYPGDLILAIDVGSDIDPKEDFSKQKWIEKGKNLTESLVRTIRIFYKNQQTFKPDSRVQVIRPHLSNYSAADVLKIKEIYEHGQRCGEEFLKN